MLEKVKEFVNEKINGKDPIHFERTVYWVEQLKLDADEELLIAAYSHDIERAFRKKLVNRKEKFDEGDILVEHQVKGGQIMYDFLIKKAYPVSKALKVKTLISHHETGGSAEENLLRDADSISFLENNAPRHAKLLKYSKENIRKKFDKIFNQIVSIRAKKIAEPFYKKSIELLEADLSKN